MSKQKKTLAPTGCTQCDGIQTFVDNWSKEHAAEIPTTLSLWDRIAAILSKEHREHKDLRAEIERRNYREASVARQHAEDLAAMSARYEREKAIVDAILPQTEKRL